MLHKENKVFVVSNNKANEIINNGVPYGLYVSQYADHVLAIENATGGAWAEEFPNMDTAMRWLVESWREAS